MADLILIFMAVVGCPIIMLVMRDLGTERSKRQRHDAQVAEDARLKTFETVVIADLEQQTGEYITPEKAKAMARAEFRTWSREDLRALPSFVFEWLTKPKQP